MRFFGGCLLFILTMIVALALGSLYVFRTLQEQQPLAENKTILIAKGSSANTVAKTLEKEGIISSADYFKLQYFLNGKPDIKAGEYLFTPHMTLNAIISEMVEGKSVKRKLTIVEGRTSLEIIQQLQSEQALTGTITALPEEGSMLPETYQYSANEDRNTKITEMQKAMQETLLQVWAMRDMDVPLQTPQQLLTLASIVEKETGLATERPRVAGVFINRLRKGMPLQSDPTVTYGITLGRVPLGRLLTTADLKAPTAYNTYVIPALPPGPICNPGKAALMAVAKPEKHEFLYFVADGSGGHAFATTLDEHNKNVVNWRKLDKKP